MIPWANITCQERHGQVFSQVISGCADLAPEGPAAYTPKGQTYPGGVCGDQLAGDWQQGFLIFQQLSLLKTAMRVASKACINSCRC